MKKGKETMNHKWSKDCPVCQHQMIFHPGCCGNLPLWRCAACGYIVKWTEKPIEKEQYLLLK